MAGLEIRTEYAFVGKQGTRFVVDRLEANAGVLIDKGRHPYVSLQELEDFVDAIRAERTKANITRIGAPHERDL